MMCEMYSSRVSGSAVSLAEGVQLCCKRGGVGRDVQERGVISERWAGAAALRRMQFCRVDTAPRPWREESKEEAQQNAAELLGFDDARSLCTILNLPTRTLGVRARPSRGS